MAILDWKQCAAVESIPGKRGGAWVYKDTRTPVSVVFDNLAAGATIDEIVEWFGVTRQQVETVLYFVSRTLEAPAKRAPHQPQRASGKMTEMAHAHSV